MTQEEIKIFIEKHGAFEELVNTTLIKLQKVNYFRWSTSGGYCTTVRIEDGLVISSYEDRWNDHITVEFPANWLLLSDEELIETATIDEKLKTEKEERIKREHEEAEQKLREERERIEYLKLKAKFEK